MAVTSESLIFEIGSRRDEVVDGEFNNRYRMAYRTISTVARNRFFAGITFGNIYCPKSTSIFIG